MQLQNFICVIKDEKHGAIRLLSQNGGMSRLGMKASHKLENFFPKLLKLNFNLGTS